jgi:hypothetical protein
LPPELAGYKDVANNNTTNTLLEYYSSNYTIKLKEEAIALYRLLYNLSPRELEILYNYLVEVKCLR